MQPFSFDHIDNSRILLADTWGRLALLSVSRDQSGVSELRCVLLGEVSSFNERLLRAQGLSQTYRYHVQPQ